MRARHLGPLALAAALLAGGAPRAALAQTTPPTYLVGTLPIAAGGASVEFPVVPGLQADVAVIALGQGTYTDRNPFSHFAGWAPWASLHYDGVPNLRLTASFQEFLYQELPALGVPAWHEERLMVRARFQQPRGAAALYEMVQLDVRSFDDPRDGTPRLVFRPRFRVGQGFNLDATRIHSLVLYQELGLRYSADDYAKKAFDFFRAVIGYTWTTRRGTFATLALLGQIQLNPPATKYDFLVGPVLTFTHRFMPKAATPAEEVAPQAPDVEVQ